MFLKLEEILVLFIFASTSVLQVSGWNFPEEADKTAGERRENSYVTEKSPSAYDNYVGDVISNGIANLTLSINNALCNDRFSSRKNIVFSPISIAGALALILLGATGSTEDEIAHILGIISGTNIHNKTLTFHEHVGNLFNKLHRSDSLATLTMANAIFIQDDFKIRQTFKHISEILYKSEILNVNFKTDSVRARQTINDWVSEKTNSKIKSILDDSPPENTKLVIANALYFKGQWEFPFFQRATARRQFFLNGRQQKETVMVDMMANSGLFPYYKDESLNCEIMGFPYKGSKMTMYVVMPKDSNAENLNTLESSLTPFKLRTLIKQTKHTDAVILFPKMHLDSFIDLGSTFRSLGLRSLFNPSEANLALMTEGEDVFSSFQNKLHATNDVNVTTFDTFENLRQLTNSRTLKNPGLYADKAIHKTFMDITETGTEAAAATSISLARSSDKVVFRVDVPFFFFINDDLTKVILFWGTVYKPTPYY
ncbi:serine protease inhibitor 28Dc-like [Agrilus planipennis]|uniref:Serine protease inhibitor 28Dc-like n=1 Tax=Agrilus planipennis TaxID=224129 RepID=A0A1W4X1P5_AGRPL|nr:serine protease inhibitor 28Dc-like [Agrilus planipennis]XP_018326698.1 serine protease inhibitor 28Dc-like [Agrilus planipennis]